MTEPNPLRARGGLVDALSSTVDRGTHGLMNAPGLLRRVVNEETWREFETARRERVQYQRFVDFVETPPLKGLGSSVETIRRLIADDNDAIALLDWALSGNSAGEKPAVTNPVPTVKLRSSTQVAALRRLETDAPELYAEVVDGRLSPNRAMVQAGFRPRSVNVTISRPESVARTLRRNMKPDDLAQLIRLLSEQAD